MNISKKISAVIPVLSRRGRIKKALYQEPIPIIFPEKRLILLWNAKAGCTFSIKWMFSQMGILHDAQDYHKWVHRYRLNVYYKSKQHKEGVRLFLQNAEDFRIVKVVSNPFVRAVSSFIHATIHNYEDDLLSDFLGRQINPKNRFTFREFVQYLISIDLDQCNVHHRLQTSSLERIGLVSPLYVVHLNNSMEEIPKLEKQLQLDAIDLLALRKSAHHRPKYSSTKFMGDVRLNDIYKKISSTVPSYESFYDPEIQTMVVDAYREDFINYNFDSSAIS